MRLLPPTLFFPETKRFWFSANKKQCGNALTSDRHKKPQKVNALQTESPDAEISPDCEQIACQITKNNVKAGKETNIYPNSEYEFFPICKNGKKYGARHGKATSLPCAYLWRLCAKKSNRPPIRRNIFKLTSASGTE